MVGRDSQACCGRHCRTVGLVHHSVSGCRGQHAAPHAIPGVVRLRCPTCRTDNDGASAHHGTHQRQRTESAIPQWCRRRGDSAAGNPRHSAIVQANTRPTAAASCPQARTASTPQRHSHTRRHVTATPCGAVTQPLRHNTIRSTNQRTLTPPISSTTGAHDTANQTPHPTPSRPPDRQRHMAETAKAAGHGETLPAPWPVRGPQREH